MAPTSYIRVRDGTTGALRAVFTGTGSDGGDNGFLSVSWRKRVNDVDYCEFVINANNPDRQYLIDKNIVEVWREDSAIGLAEYKSFIGEIRDDIALTDKQNRERVTVRAFGFNGRLARRRVAYPANKANFTLFTAVAVETIMKRLVRYNCDPAYATTANGRDRTPNTLNLTIALDTASVPFLNWSCGNRPNLLTELQKIARIGNHDFNVVNVASDSAPLSLQFTTYIGQLGADRTIGSNPIIFSSNRGNMASPTLARIRSTEKTVAIVGGRGEDDQRVIVVRTGTNYSATNDIEEFIDGRNGSDVLYLNALGDSALVELRARNVIEYEVIQTTLYTAEKDYFLGDLVTAEYSGVSATQQVYDITFEYERLRENVSIVMRDR